MSMRKSRITDTPVVFVMSFCSAFTETSDGIAGSESSRVGMSVDMAKQLIELMSKLLNYYPAKPETTES